MIHKIINKAKSLSGIQTVIEAENKVLREKLDESLFFIHQLKNRQTVSMGHNEALTRIFTGQLMYVDTRDVSVAPHLMMSGKWEENITSVFTKLINKDDVVFDVGANFGFFGVVAGSITMNKIVFVEANPHLIPYIKKTLSVTGLIKRSVIENKAVSDKTGNAKFNFLNDAWGSSGLLDADVMSKGDGVNYTVQELIDVQLTTVDLIAKENNIKTANIIKLDVEGVEPQAYDGMKNLIKNSPDLKLFIEFTPVRYKKPKLFFNTVLKDFSYLYSIDESNGALHRIKSYENLDFDGEAWTMLVASKKKLDI